MADENPLADAYDVLSRFSEQRKKKYGAGAETADKSLCHIAINGISLSPQQVNEIHVALINHRIYLREHRAPHENNRLKQMRSTQMSIIAEILEIMGKENAE